MPCECPLIFLTKASFLQSGATGAIKERSMDERVNVPSVQRT